ncbi:MAG: DUF1385 domain-containing protein [Acutalibacteraceae bacterium]|nr:DUF1385 domain-containing protein [Acutalibacteraceae bacterium]
MSKNCDKKKCKYTSIGGQALIEGIMMKSPEKSAMAVRLPDGNIDITYMNEKSLKEKYKILGIPVVRGVVGFVESMINGYKAMMLSADKSGFADEVDEDTGEVKKLSSKAWGVLMAVAGVLAVILSIALFMYLPRLAVSGLQLLFKVEGFPDVVNSLIEQGIKLVVFLSYIIAVSYMKDIRRVFQYHGAEHKTIFCYEAGLPLTVENAKQQKRFHPRCGTSFMILMILISIIFSTLAQIVFTGVYENAIVWTLIKLAMVPLICGVGYEVLKLCGRYDNIITRIISAPGVWVQRITTKEPDDSMLEIAIAALGAVLSDEDKEKYLPDTEENNDNI